MKYFFSFLLLIIFFALPATFFGGNKPVAAKNPPSADWIKLEQQIKDQAQRFPGNSGIIIQDLKRGWTIEHNPDRIFASASLVKLPMMAALYQEQNRGQISLTKNLRLERRFKTAGSGILKRQKSGTLYSINDLIFLMITKSDNTATNMLTSLLGMQFYDHSFKELGLLHTNLVRTIMDLNKRKIGIDNWTTPQDMALVLKAIYKNQVPGSKQMLNVLKAQDVKDRLAIATPKDWPIAHKTGTIDGVCHDVGIVFSPSGDYLICVLTSDLNNLRQCKRFIRLIARTTAKHYQNRSALAPQS